MEYRELGGTGEKLSAIGLGTWQLGRDAHAEAAALGYGLDLGINFIDTAEIYGSESVVGDAIGGREGVFVASKVWPSHFRYDDVIGACDASLRRLGVKSIDLYQLHFPSGSVPIRETMRAMERLVADGKIRYIGVSNFPVQELKEAQAALKKNEIASNQVEYSILVRDVERRLLGYCTKERITVIAYSPLAHGALYGNGHAKLRDALAGVGAKYGKTATQVALNWLLAKPGVIPIPKASRKEHIAEAAGACDWRMSRGDYAKVSGFLSMRRRRPVAGIAGPVLKHVPFASKLAEWAMRH